MRNLSTVVSCVAIASTLFFASCDATNPVPLDPLLVDDSVKAENSKSFNDGTQSRVLSVYLNPEPDYSFLPEFNGRIVVAEPVYTVPVDMARGKAIVDGVAVVYVGESCDTLLAGYPDIQDCTQEETAEFQYGEVESTATTDSDGFATLTPGNAAKYRVRVKSWVTTEDDKCFWGGSETIGSEDTEVSVPVLVFCE